MQLFDVSTTVDPSYVISLIRKLLPPCSTSSIVTRENEDKTCDSVVELEGECMEEGGLSKPENEVADVCNDEYDSLDTVNAVGEVGGRDACDERSSSQDKHEVAAVGEKAWEEYGCVLWDLAANETHAEFMVINLSSKLFITLHCHLP